MGLTVAELVATLGADASDFDQGLDGLLGKFGPIGGAATAAAAVAVAAIATIGVAVIHYGGQFDEAFDSIRIGTGATGKALAGLEGRLQGRGLLRAHRLRLGEFGDHRAEPAPRAHRRAAADALRAVP